jgi:hypothetical protein
MSFFGNDAINRVILHSGIQALAQGAAGVFVFVFLLRAGVPLPFVFLSLAAMVGARFLMRPMVLPLAKRFGVRSTLVLGTVLEAAIFPILPLVHGPGPLLVVAVLVGAVGSVLYWTSYHAFFASLGDVEHRGGQIGAKEAVAAIVGIVAPLIGGWGLVTGGPWITFIAAAVVQALAAIPLLGAPQVKVVDEAPGGFRAAMLGSAMLATDGWFAAGFYYTWQIALFVSLGESFTAYGGAMALAGVVGAVSGMVFGRWIDIGHGRKAALITYGIAAAVIVLRAASLETPWLAVLANAAGPLIQTLQATAMMTLVYNLAKASPCPLRFHIATEGGWDLGCGLGCLTAAGLAALGQPLSAPILLALIGGAAACLMLLRSYARP